MERVRVERLDHLGLIASVIKALGLMDMMDTRLVPDAQEVITPGEAVAAMILNGLGFANRPLSLTPQFFAHKPLDLLFREGIEAAMFNRFKLGRTLDEAHTSGCDLLFEELARAICAQEGIDLRFKHLDTTSFALPGEYIPDSDEHAMRITHGYSKDHRPDLQQVVLELMVSQDGGVPFVSKSWDGNTSDTQVVQQRAEALMRAFKDTPRPRSLVADAKLSCEANAADLAQLGFITRIPGTLTVWWRRSSAKRSSGTPGSLLMTIPALSLWRWATMVWSSVGWWCLPRQLMSVPQPRSTKPNSAKTRLSISSSFTCKPNAFALPKLLKLLSPHWPSAGGIIKGCPLI
jgi:transposase